MGRRVHLVDQNDPADVLDYLRTHTTQENGHWIPRSKKQYVDTTTGMVRVNRLAYELVFEPLPPGMRISSTCGVKNCLHPKHQLPVDIAAAVNAVERRQWLNLED